MKCPKCSYLGFETGDRCRNCGYDFSLIAGETGETDERDVRNGRLRPDEFDLEVRQKERTFRARMVWRRQNEAGITFVGQDSAGAPIPLDWARRLRDCETQKASLRRRVEQLSNAE